MSTHESASNIARASRPEVAFGSTAETNIHSFPGNTLEAGRQLLATRSAPRQAPLLELALPPIAVERAPKLLNPTVRIPRTRREPMVALVRLWLARTDVAFLAWLADKNRVTAETRAAATVIVACAAILLSYLAVA
jgi:hypothetical protein